MVLPSLIGSDRLVVGSIHTRIDCCFTTKKSSTLCELAFLCDPIHNA
jgi:hypothetical protein